MQRAHVEVLGGFVGACVVDPGDFYYVLVSIWNLFDGLRIVTR